MEEIWKDVVGYEGLYEVSNFGLVRSVDRVVTRKTDGALCYLKGKKLTQQIDSSGRYWMVTLSKNGVEKSYKVHSLVANAFLPNSNSFLVVMHKDEKNLKYDGVCNNRVDNLEWGTLSENSSSPVARERNATSKNMSGENNPMYGKTQSEETRGKISAKLKGKGGRISRSKKVVCEGILYDCVTDCAMTYGIKTCTMMSWLRGDRPMREDFKERGLAYV